MDTPIHIQKHTPERRRQSVTALHCGCCCCCCCCLHTIGSIVGAAVAPAIGRGERMPITYFYDEISGEEVPLIKKPGLSSVTVFWWLTCLLIFLGFAYGIVEGRAQGEALLVTGIIVLLVFPGLQVVSAFFTVLIYAVWPRPDKYHQLIHLGKIVIGIFLGGVLGIIVMVVIGVGFSLLAR
jgi:hypothetical protein